MEGRESFILTTSESKCQRGQAGATLLREGRGGCWHWIRSAQLPAWLPSELAWHRRPCLAGGCGIRRAWPPLPNTLSYGRRGLRGGNGDGAGLAALLVAEHVAERVLSTPVGQVSLQRRFIFDNNHTSRL